MSAIVIQEYKPMYQPYFEKLNKAWLNKYFRIEPVDEFVLTQPEEAILKKGGAILVALQQEEVTGVVALRKVNDTTYEFTKMAVSEQYQRKGIAEKLSLQAFEKVKQLGGNKIILYTHSSLQPALTLYNKLGFKQVPLNADCEYERSDIKMELSLATTG